jgi:hypothetical protein
LVEAALVNEHDDTFAFGYRAVQDRAPNASGVYTIYNAQQWLYVGESDDIRQSLFGHLNQPGACLARRGPLSFSFEVVSPERRLHRQHALVTALLPACNPPSPTATVEKDALTPSPLPGPASLPR